MEAYKKQQRILNDCAKENEDAHKRYAESIRAGATVTLKGEIVGPYTTRTSYWLSDGNFVTLVTPSSLIWAYALPVFKV